MKSKIQQCVKGYHYTNPEAYKSMQTRGINGHYSSKFDEFKGLILRKRFVNLREGKDLPNKAYDGVIEGLLEPEPESWIKNPEFPHLWSYLMHDICREKEVILLSFELNKKDEAYIVDRAHVERELYRESKGQGKTTKETRDDAYMKYWKSRVKVFDYEHNTKKYSVPQLSLWSGMGFERLNIEWIKPTDEVWKRIVDYTW
jgi:hypothetical protein